MRTVLFVTYYYPPSVDAGAKRSEGFARYLPDHGYEPIVLTVRDGNYQTAGSAPAPDPEWVMRVAERTFLPPRSRVPAEGAGALPRTVAPPLRWIRRLYREAFHQPDAFWGFHRPALASALQLIRQRRIDVILTTSSPFTLLRTGHALRVRTGLPWVADLRDLWVHSHFGYPFSRLRRFVDARLERRWLSAASHVTTATEGLASVLRATGFGALPIRCVYNGYFDPAPPSAGEPAMQAPPSELSVCYTGTLHERGSHSVESFLAALAWLREHRPDLQVKARFYGGVNADFTAQIERFALAGAVTYGGRVSREDAESRQRAADVLLLIVPDHPDQEVAVYSKTFDYLAARRPLLAIIPRGGENARILAQVGAGKVFAPSEVEAIARWLAELADRKRASGRLPLEGDERKIAAFHYRSLAGELAQVLDAAIAAPSRR